MTNRSADVEERFWARVDKNGPIPEHMPWLGSCWVWTGSRNRQGYGRFQIGGNSTAHRYAFGPTSLHVLHRCDNPPCVRRDHLFEGTHTDNMRDRVVKGRHHEVKKTHCPRGHEYTPENTSTNDLRPNRHCKTCNRESMARRKALKQTPARL